MNMSIGNNLKKLRQKHGFSQELLAEKLGISRQAISKWENETSKPSTGNLIKITNLYEVDIEDLTKDDVKKEENKNEQSIKYFKSYEDKMLVLSFLSRVGITIALTGYYGYYLPSPDAPLIHWILLFILSCGLIFYCNSKYYGDKHANKKLYIWDLALTFTMVFIPRILPFSIGWNILTMNLLAAILVTFIIGLIRKRWPI